MSSITHQQSGFSQPSQQAFTTPFASMSQAAGVTLSTTPTAINWDTIVYNAQGIWVPNTGFVVPVAGVYNFNCQLTLGSNPTAETIVLQTQMTSGGAFYWTAGVNNAGSAVALQLDIISRCNVGDIINLTASTSVGTQNLVTGSNNSSRAQLAYMGP